MPEINTNTISPIGLQGPQGPQGPAGPAGISCNQITFAQNFVNGDRLSPAPCSLFRGDAGAFGGAIAFSVEGSGLVVGSVFYIQIYGLGLDSVTITAALSGGINTVQLNTAAPVVSAIMTDTGGNWENEQVFLTCILGTGNNLFVLAASI